MSTFGDEMMARAEASLNRTNIPLSTTWTGTTANGLKVGYGSDILLDGTRETGNYNERGHREGVWEIYPHNVSGRSLINCYGYAPDSGRVYTELLESIEFVNGQTNRVFLYSKFKPVLCTETDFLGFLTKCESNNNEIPREKLDKILECVSAVTSMKTNRDVSVNAPQTLTNRSFYDAQTDTSKKLVFSLTGENDKTALYSFSLLPDSIVPPLPTGFTINLCSFIAESPDRAAVNVFGYLRQILGLGEFSCRFKIQDFGGKVYLYRGTFRDDNENGGYVTDVYEDKEDPMILKEVKDAAATQRRNLSNVVEKYLGERQTQEFVDGLLTWAYSLKRDFQPGDGLLDTELVREMMAEDSYWMDEDINNEVALELVKALEDPENGFVLKDDVIWNQSKKVVDVEATKKNAPDIHAWVFDQQKDIATQAALAGRRRMEGSLKTHTDSEPKVATLKTTDEPKVATLNTYIRSTNPGGDTTCVIREDAVIDGVEGYLYTPEKLEDETIPPPPPFPQRLPPPPQRAPPPPPYAGTKVSEEVVTRLDELVKQDE